MDSEPKPHGARPTPWSQQLRLWLILAAIAFLVLLLVALFISDERYSYRQGLCLVGLSLAIATIGLGSWLAIRWACRGKNFWRIVGAGGVLMVVAALFYTEEDLRGWYAWNRFKWHWESKGERFHLANTVPAAVPDDQNFALTPIAFSGYGHVLTRAGELIPEAKRDPHFVTRMRVAIAPVYPGPANAAGNRVQGTFTRLDIWQDYYRELATKTNDLPVPARAGSPAKDVLFALSRYDDVLNELRAANRLHYSRFPLNYTSDSPLMIHLPHLAALKSCAQLLQLRSAAELADGQADQACADIVLALQLAEKVRTEPLVISHLVRAAMLQLALQPVWEGLARHRWSDLHLLALDHELANLDFVADWKLSMRSELGGQVDELDRLRRHPDQLPEVQVLIDYVGKQNEVHLPSKSAARFFPAGWFYQTQYRCAKMMEDYCIPMADPSRRIFVPGIARRGAVAVAAEANSRFGWFGPLIFPVLADAAPKFAYAQASADMARLAIALERCRQSRGELPGSLEQLVPQWIDQVPHDVIGGGALHYQREAGGGFLLYSIGWNEQDEAGMPSFKQGTVDLQSGDWIWRSLPETP